MEISSGAPASARVEGSGHAGAPERGDASASDTVAARNDPSARNAAARRTASETIRASFLSLVPRMIVLHDQVAKDTGLSSAELQVLHVISLAAQSLSPGTISRKTGLAPSTVTRTLDGLERRGFARRSPDPDDQRRVIVTLDAAATAPVGERFNAYARAMRRVDAEFSADELAVVARHWAALGEAVDAELDAEV